MRDLRFQEKSPDKGYVTNQLLIPKGVVNLAAIKNALTFYLGEEEDVLDELGAVLRTKPKAYQMWDETEHHIIVPRAFFTEEMREEFTQLHEVEWVKERLESIRLFLPDNIVPRDESQEKALEAMARHQGGTVNLACGRGKTVVALKYWVLLQKPALVVVNSTALADQWMRKIRFFLSEDIDIGFIGSGKCQWKGCPITIATVHSLANKRDEWPMEFRRHFGVVFFDEGHHMAAPWFVRAADLFFGERFSLTATAFRTDGLEAISMYHIGDIIYQDLEQELIPDTIFHKLEWDFTEEQEVGRLIEYIDPGDQVVKYTREGGVRDKSGKVHHRKLCIELGKISKRNACIMRRLEQDMEEGRQVLLLTHSVEHTRKLGALARQLWSSTGVVNGEDVDPFDRIPLLEQSNPVIGTFDLAREALDKDVLDTLHVCTPFGNSNDLQQSWGRIQRRKPGKNHPRVRVYEDLIRPSGLSKQGKRKSIKMSVEQCRLLKTYLRALLYPFTEKKETTN